MALCQGLKANQLIWARSTDDGRTWCDPVAFDLPLPGAAGGEQEANARKVAVRARGDKPDQGVMPLEEFIQRCEQEVSTRGAAHATAAPSPEAQPVPG